MNRAELVEAVRRELGRDAARVEAERAVRAVLEAIGIGLRRDRNVQLVGFGTFKAVRREARGENQPDATTTVGSTALTSVRFAAGKRLRNQLGK